MSSNPGQTAVDAYISDFPQAIQERLNLMRETILLHAPDAVESISYGLAAYKTNGKPLVYFGGFTKHIGFYATPNGHQQFKAELAGYKQGKGSVQFPNTIPLPLELIADIVKFRFAQNKKK